MILKLQNIILQLELEKNFSIPVEGLIVSDDVNLIMRPGEITLSPKESTEKDWNKVIAQAGKKLPKKLGSVITEEGRKARAYGKHFPVTHLFIAIIYNFDLEQPCRRKFVERALRACFKKAAELKLTNIALNPIGCAYKGIPLKEFSKILVEISEYQMKKKSPLQNIFLLLSSQKEKHLIIEHLKYLDVITGIMPEVSENKNFLEM
jgi:O-acetyl-ADP-ribose deacetylase (regulator of RNase III)